MIILCNRHSILVSLDHFFSFFYICRNMKNEVIDLSLIDTTKNTQIYDRSFDIIQRLGLSEQITHILNSVILLSITIAILFIIDFLARKILLAIFTKLIIKTKTKIDDYLLQNKVLNKIAHLAPILIAHVLLPIVFVAYPNWLNAVTNVVDIVMVLAILSLINAVLKTIIDIFRSKKALLDKPLDSYLQVAQIFLIFVAGTIIFSIITGKSPLSFLVSLGAASAILMLVFKDTILGFVASIQVSANDSVRVGDWIEMSKYGADGTVLKITLNNVKVQNFDKTIVSIPTHTFLSDSFKNYRGMQESGGRRIKRAINIKISSIRYLTEDEIDALRSIHLLKPFIEERQREINAYNAEHDVDQTNLVNGRRMTNVGLFRAYIMRYALQNKNIHKEYALMVRQLSPTEYGLPLELYMFTNSIVWAEYEEIMSNMFDHLFAAIKYFHLEIFELPASDDLRTFIQHEQR